jgi:PAN domain
MYPIAPSLSQGLTYINKSKRRTKTINYSNSSNNNSNKSYLKEGFTNPPITEMIQQGFNQDILDNVQNSINSQFHAVDQLYDQYDRTNEQLAENQNNILAQIRNAIDRKSAKNAYLNQNIQLNNDSNETGYVTNQGVFKKFLNNDRAWSAGKNGVPTSLINVNSTNSQPIEPGMEIPIDNNPSLIAGQPMNLEQSVGHEGQNIYVNSMVDESTARYGGCGLAYPSLPIKKNENISITSATSSNPDHPVSNLITNDTSSYWQSGIDYDPETGYTLNQGLTIEENNIYKWDWNGWVNNNNTSIKGCIVEIDYNKPQIVRYYTLNVRGNPPDSVPVSWWLIAYAVNIVNNQPLVSFTVLDRQEDQFPGNISDNQYNVKDAKYNPTTVLLIVDKIYVNSDLSEDQKNTVIINKLDIYTQDVPSAKRDNFVDSGLGYVSPEECKQYAIDKAYTFYSMINPQDNGTAQCYVSNNATSYGSGSNYYQVQVVKQFNQTIDNSKSYMMLLLWSGAVWGVYYDTRNNGNSIEYTTINNSELLNSCYFSRGSLPLLNGNEFPGYLSAYYGTNCPNSDNKDVTSYVKQQIIDQNNSNDDNNVVTPKLNLPSEVGDMFRNFSNKEFNISVNNDALTDTSVGCPKNFTISYMCGLDVKTKTLDYGEGQVVTLDCTDKINACKVYLIMQDDGNLCMYNGDYPTSEPPPSLWCSWTQGQQADANPNWESSKGKNGRNYLKVGDILNPGEWIGNTNGSMRFILTAEGVIEIQTSRQTNLCTEKNNVNFGTNLANAIYSIIPGIKSLLGKFAYIDADSVAHEYTSDNLTPQNTYTLYPGYDSNGNDLALYNVNNISECEQKCSETDECRAFSYSTNSCYLKNENAYPKGQKNLNSKVTLGVRNIGPSNSKMNLLPTTNINTLYYNNYVKGDNMSEDILNQNSINVATSQLNNLSSVNNQLTSLGSQIAKQQGIISQENTDANNAMNTAANNLNNSLNDYNSMKYQAETDSAGNHPFVNFKSNTISSSNKISNNFMGREGLTNLGANDINGMLSDSDLIVLQQNYAYILWSLIAVGLVIIVVFYVKKSKIK